MPARLTTEKIIEKAIKIHGNKYDYSEVKYEDYQTKIHIICKKHGDFFQKINYHLSGNGCPTCGGTYRLSNEQFIQKAKEKHKEKYTYSKVKYINYTTPVIITCKTHGDFSQTPNDHLYGKGCSICARTKIYSASSFIKRAIKIHGNKYDYSKVKDSINRDQITTIICKKHGEFLQKFNNHLHGGGCPTCAGNEKLTEYKILQKFNEKYKNKEFKIIGWGNKNKKNYGTFNDFYTNPQESLLIFSCPNHGIQKILIREITNKRLRHGCSVCGTVSQTKKNEDRAKNRTRKNVTTSYGYIETWVDRKDIAKYVVDYKNRKGSKNKTVLLEHIYIMAKHLGRPIDTKKESVHHKNGNRVDNRIENLELRHRYHGSGHSLMDRIESEGHLLSKKEKNRIIKMLQE